MANAKIDIKVGEIQISLEGPESFVKEQYNKITGELDGFQTMSAEVASDTTPRPAKKTKAKTTGKKRGLKPGSTRKAKPGPKPGTKRKAKPGPKPSTKRKAKPGPKPKAAKTTTKKAAKTKTKTKAATRKKGTTTKATSLPKEFGQWLKMAPAKLSKTDNALLAGFYVQLNSGKGSFRVREASKVLKENNINLSNTSIFIRNNLSAKKVFQHSKTGSEPNYRLTDLGLEHVKNLLGV